MVSFKLETPHNAVFKEPFGSQGTPLFESQVELAKAILKSAETGFMNKKPETVRSAISQIFTGERNLSNSLRHALFTVIEPRFDKEKFDYKKFQKLLVEAFKSVYEERMEDKKNRVADRDFNTLMKATKLGKEFLITTLEPAELHKSELANRLKNELLEKTRIVKSSFEITEAKYKFYLPNREGGRIAREFWEALRKHAIEEYDLKPGDVDKKLKSANEEGIIETYLAPTYIAMHPYVFIDYSNPRKVTGFCVSYRNNEIPSVAELSLKVVYNWFDEYKEEIKKIEAIIEDDNKKMIKINSFPYEPK